MRNVCFGLIFIFLSSSVWAESMTFSKSVRVISSEPIYRTVVKRKPYQECWDEEVPVTYGGTQRSGDNVASALIGGAAGGILGHQIGKGHGKDAATIGGAIIGSLIGQSMVSPNRRDYHTSYKTQRRCVTKYTETTEERITRYKNVAEYKGHTIIKYSDRPLRRIPITVTVSY
jgi:uncharacterized protein YcfJ